MSSIAESSGETAHDGEFDQVTYVLSPVSSLVIEKSEDGGFSTKQVERDVEHRVTTVTGTIENSLFLAAQKAGLSDALTMELAGIFAWDVDFVLDIRQAIAFSEYGFSVTGYEHRTHEMIDLRLGRKVLIGLLGYILGGDDTQA